MDLSVTCECGVKTQVTPTMCGSTVVCDCGKSFEIPRLRELRRTSGTKPDIVGVADQLHVMFVDGLLPTESECVSCGCSCDTHLDCLIECERMYAKKQSYASYFLRCILQCILAPFLCILFLSTLLLTKREYDDVEVLGRELLVRTPIRLCTNCFSKTKMTRKICHGLLQKNERYAKLLSEYPSSVVVWDAALSRSDKTSNANGSHMAQ